MKNKNSSTNLIPLFMKKKNEIIWITLTITLIGITYALLATKWYKVEVKIIPSETNDNMLLKEYANIAALAGVNLPVSGTSYQNFYPDILNSNYILDKVLIHNFWIETLQDSLTLPEFWESKIDSLEKDWKIKLYEKARKKLRNEYIKVENDELTGMIILTVYAPKDRGLSAELANYLIEQLDKYNKTHRKTTAKEQRKFIEKAIHENTISLTKAENKLIDYETKNKDIVSPEQRIIHNRLLTNVEIYRNILLELKKQLELVKIEEVKQIPTLNIIEKANKPFFKDKPKRLIIVILSFILGLVVALIYSIISTEYKNMINNILTITRKK